MAACPREKAKIGGSTTIVLIALQATIVSRNAATLVGHGGAFSMGDARELLCCERQPSVDARRSTLGGWRLHCVERQKAEDA